MWKPAEDAERSGDGSLEVVAVDVTARSVKENIADLCQMLLIKKSGCQKVEIIFVFVYKLRNLFAGATLSRNLEYVPL